MPRLNCHYLSGPQCREGARSALAQGVSANMASADQLQAYCWDGLSQPAVCTPTSLVPTLLPSLLRIPIPPDIAALHVTCHCCLLPGSLGPPCLSSGCWAGPGAHAVCLLGCMLARHRWTLPVSLPPGVTLDTMCHAPAQGYDPLSGPSSLCPPMPIDARHWGPPYFGGSYPV